MTAEPYTPGRHRIAPGWWTPGGLGRRSRESTDRLDMILNIPDNLAIELRARSAQQGLEPEPYTVGLLWRAVVEQDPPMPKNRNKRKKGPLVSDVSDDDYSDIFKFGGETPGGPTVDDLTKPVRLSKG